MPKTIEHVHWPDAPDLWMPYAPAIKVKGGTTVYLAGVTAAPVYHHHPHRPEEFDSMPRDMAGQARAALENLKRGLEAVGASFADIVTADRFVTDLTDQDALNRVWGEYFGDAKAEKLIKDIVATLQPVITDGHLAQARSVGSGEYWLSLNNYVNLTLNVKLAGGPIDYFALDPVTLIFGQVGVSAKAPHPNTALLAANFMLSQECQAFLATFGRIPTRADVASNPPGIVELMRTKKVVTELLTPEEERTWQRNFDSLFKTR